MSARAYIRCTCGFWRDVELPTRADAEAQYEEWQREHANHARAGGVTSEKAKLFTMHTEYKEDEQ